MSCCKTLNFSPSKPQSAPFTTSTPSSVAPPPLPQLKNKPPPPEAPPAVNKPKYNTMRPQVISNTPKPPPLKRTESTEETSSSNKPRRPTAPPPPPPPMKPVGNDSPPPPPPPPRHTSVSNVVPQPPSMSYGAVNNNGLSKSVSAQPLSPVFATSHISTSSGIGSDASFEIPSSTPPDASSRKAKIEERFRFTPISKLPPPEIYTKKLGSY